MRSTDVLVVGAGPAGSIAALTLARAGVRTIIVEAKRFPRDKVCGDALIPDSLTLLDEVGLLAEVEAIAHRATAVRMVAPNGRSFPLRAPFLTLRRQRLDALLAEAATRAGAELLDGVRISAPLRRGAAIAGARGKSDSGAEISISAPITILATGGASAMLRAFGVELRSRPSAVAMRGYYEAPNLPASELIISWETPVLPGYGWIFPMANGEANVGVGMFLAGARLEANLRTLFKRFTEECANVSELLRGAAPVGKVRGAPLRCNFDGARPVGAGLLVAGETIGTTYGYSGEGIGKAMESGRMAGRVAASCTKRGRADAWALGAYVNAMAAAGFPERYKRYQQAQRWMAHPAIVNQLARRANKGTQVTSILEGVIREERSPDELLSLLGILRMLVG